MQQLKGRTKLTFCQNKSYYYDELNIRRQSGSFQLEEGPFSKGAHGKAKIMHEVKVLLKFLQTKHEIENIINNFYDLFFTVIKNRDEQEIVNECENDKDYKDFDDFSLLIFILTEKMVIHY